MARVFWVFALLVVSANGFNLRKLSGDDERNDKFTCASGKVVRIEAEKGSFMKISS